MSTAPADRRAGYIAGLRDLADRLEGHPACPLPFFGVTTALAIYVYSLEEYRAAAAAIGGDKQPGRLGVELAQTLAGGLHVQVVPNGDGICERVKVGTEKVKVLELPDDIRERYEVEVEQPVWETRCPESLLRPVTEADVEVALAADSARVEVQEAVGA